MTSPRRIAARRGYRQLDRAKIVTAALALARDHGMAAVTIRAIAHELGNAPMALYRHITDREELVIAMLDAVAADIVVPPPSQDPRTEIVGLVSAVHQVLHRDAWVVMVQVTEGLASSNILPVLDRLFAALRAAGLSARDATTASGIIWSYTYGELLSSHYDKPDSYARRMVRSADPVTYPSIGEVVRDSSADSGEEHFLLGIEIVVDGLLARLGSPLG